MGLKNGNSYLQTSWFINMCPFWASHTGKVILVERKLQVSKGMVTISGDVSKQKTRDKF